MLPDRGCSNFSPIDSKYDASINIQSEEDHQRISMASRKSSVPDPPRSENSKNSHGPSGETLLEKITQDNADLSHMKGILRALKKLGRIQKRVVDAQIDAREKRRRAGYKRRDVWNCDASFMKELQNLIEQEKLKGFENLLKMAGDCQTTRDGLRLLEEEGTEAEQHLEGEVWKLQEAENYVNDVFEREFSSMGDMDSVSSSSSASEQFQSESDPEGYISSAVYPDYAIEHPISQQQSTASSTVTFETPGPRLSTEDTPIEPQHLMLSGIQHTAPSAQYDSNWENDSGIEDLDQLLEPPTHSLNHNQPSSTERYPSLSTDFETRRERVNRWLLNTILLSHHEADLLKNILATENEAMPSNWSQLVIAYWELDAAAQAERKTNRAIPVKRTTMGDLMPLRKAPPPPPPKWTIMNGKDHKS